MYCCSKSLGSNSGANYAAQCLFSGKGVIKNVELGFMSLLQAEEGGCQLSEKSKANLDSVYKSNPTY